MANNKTPEEFINNVKNEIRRKDSFTLMELIQNQTGFEPEMWGKHIVGFGSCHYKYGNEIEGDTFIIAFSPRTSALVLCLSAQFEERIELLKKLGKHKIDEKDKSRIHIKNFDEINMDILKQIITNHLKNHIRISDK